MKTRVKFSLCVSEARGKFLTPEYIRGGFAKSMGDAAGECDVVVGPAVGGRVRIDVSADILAIDGVPLPAELARGMLAASFARRRSDNDDVLLSNDAEVLP